MSKLGKLQPGEVFSWLERIESLKYDLSKPPANGWYSRDGLLSNWFLNQIHRCNTIPSKPGNYLSRVGCTELQVLERVIKLIMLELEAYKGRAIWFVINKLCGRGLVDYLDTLQSNFDTLKPVLVETGRCIDDELDSLFRSTFILDKEVYRQIIPKEFGWFVNERSSGNHAAFSLENEIASANSPALGSKILLGVHKETRRFEFDIESWQLFDNFSTPDY